MKTGSFVNLSPFSEINSPENRRVDGLQPEVLTIDAFKVDLLRQPRLLINAHQELFSDFSNAEASAASKSLDERSNVKNCGV